MGAAADGDDDLIAKFDKLGVKLLDSHGELRKVGDVLPELAQGPAQRRLREPAQRPADGIHGPQRLAHGDRAARRRRRQRRPGRRGQAQGAVVGGETIKAWDDLSDALDVGKQRMDSAAGDGWRKPIATNGLNAAQRQLATMAMLDGPGQARPGSR
jgi:hypothetical protein